MPDLRGLVDWRWIGIVAAASLVAAAVGFAVGMWLGG